MLLMEIHFFVCFVFFVCQAQCENDVYMEVMEIHLVSLMGNLLLFAMVLLYHMAHSSSAVSSGGGF